MPGISELQDLQELERDVREIAAADSPAAVFKRILQSCCRHAPRGALFLVRKGQVCGWSGFGYRPEVLAALREFRAAAGPGWTDGGADPDFGQPAAVESRLIPVEVKSQPIAFILLERGADDRSWKPEGPSVLATVARLRLELDLAQRKAAEPVAAIAVAAPAVVQAPLSRPAAPERPLPEAAVEALAVEPSAAAEPPAAAAARRYARLIATDIRLYHEDDVLAGQREGDLVARLATQLDLGKQTFLKRHADLGPAGLALLREAYIDVLAAGKAGLIPPRALD